MKQQDNGGLPSGWDEWQAFLMSDTYTRDVEELIDAIQAGRHLDIGLSIACLASCAFAAGMDAANPSARVAAAGEGA